MTPATFTYSTLHIDTRTGTLCFHIKEEVTPTLLGAAIQEIVSYVKPRKAEDRDKTPMRFIRFNTLSKFPIPIYFDDSLETVASRYDEFGKMFQGSSTSSPMDRIMSYMDMILPKPPTAEDPPAAE